MHRGMNEGDVGRKAASSGLLVNFPSPEEFFVTEVATSDLFREMKTNWRDIVLSIPPMHEVHSK